MHDQRAEVEWREGGVPVSTRFDDPYFSLEDGLAETRHTFLGGNDLPARFVDGFHVAELGFGTGLNLAATLSAWRAAKVPGVLRYTSFEAYPMLADEMAMALSRFPALGPVVTDLLPHLGGQGFTLDDLEFDLIAGDARELLPAWQGRADAWFLDGFSPAKNPELWGAPLLSEVGAHTAPGGTAATYTAAGHVRRALADAGFEVTRAKGFGRKRHMTQARMPAK